MQCDGLQAIYMNINRLEIVLTFRHPLTPTLSPELRGGEGRVRGHACLDNYATINTSILHRGVNKK
jgi:hypothetical protein